MNDKQPIGPLSTFPADPNAPVVIPTGAIQPDAVIASRELPANTLNVNLPGEQNWPTSNAIRDDDEIELEIQTKGLTAPRVTPQRIEDVIASEYYFTALQGARMAVLDHADDSGDVTALRAELDPLSPALGLLTFCVLVLQNGFTVTGESACASPENFNAELGRKIARQHAVAKIWQLEGYALRQRLYDQALAAGGIEVP